MLNKEFTTFLADTLGVDLEKLKEAVTSETEVEVLFKSGTLMDDEALTGLKETVKGEGYKEGKVAGVEMAIKAGKEKHGLEFEGKSIENFAEALSKKVIADAKIDPDKKVKAAKESVEKLQKTYDTDIGLKENEIKSLNRRISEYTINGDIAKHLPDNLTGIKSNQFATLARTEYGFDYEGGVFVAKRGDTILKDKLEKPLQVKDVLTDYAKQNGWIKTDGRGGGDNGGGSGSDKFETMNDVYKHMHLNKIDPMSSEGDKLVTDFTNSQKE